MLLRVVWISVQFICISLYKSVTDIKFSHRIYLKTYCLCRKISFINQCHSKTNLNPLYINWTMFRFMTNDLKLLHNVMLNISKQTEFFSYTKIHISLTKIARTMWSKIIFIVVFLIFWCTSLVAFFRRIEIYIIILLRSSSILAYTWIYCLEYSFVQRYQPVLKI